MYRFICIFIFLVSTCSFSILKAQVNFNIERAYSENSFRERVNAILKDSEGYLWLGTKKGLFRYDGTTFLLFNKLGFIPGVTGIIEDDSGNLWLSTENGIFTISDDRETQSNFFVEDSLKTTDIDSWFTDIKIDQDGAIWTVKKDGSVISFHENQFQTVIKKDTNSKLHLSKLKLDETQSLWLGYNNGKISQLNKNGNELNEFVSSNLIGDFALSNNNPYLYQYKSGSVEQIHRVKHELVQKFKIPSHTPLNPENGPFFKFYTNGKKIWMANDRQFLAYIDESTNRLIPLYKDLPANFGKNNHVISFLNENQDEMWLGTNEGLFHLTSLQSAFTPLPFIASQPNSSSTRAILRISPNELLLFTYNIPLIYNEQKKNVKPFLDTNQNIIGYTHQQISDSIFIIASEGAGIFLLNTNEKQLEPLFPDSYYLSNNNKLGVARWQFSTALIKDQLFIGTLRGLYSLDLNSTSKKLTPFSPTSHAFMKSKIMALEKDENDQLWAASSQGLFQLNPKKKSVKKISLVDPLIEGRSLLVDNNFIWLGSLEKGIYRYDTITKSSIHLDERNGLYNKCINAILKSTDNSLWVTTNDGFSKLDTTALSFSNYFVPFWKGPSEFNHSANWIDNDGTFYLGGVNGVIKVAPFKLPTQQNKPRVLMTEFSKNEGDNGEQRYTKRFGIEKNSRFTFKPDYRYFSIRLSSLHLQQHEEKFFYRIKELGKEWQNIGSRNTLTFASLPAGDFTLEVKSRNKFGTWSDINRIHLSLNKVWYKQWWAILLFILIIASIAYFWYKMHIDKLRYLHKLELQEAEVNKLQEIDNTKSRIFANLAHEFRTPLTLIKGPAQRIKKLTSKSEISSSAELISNQSEKLLRMVNQLLNLSSVDAGNITWRPSTLSIQSFMTKITNDWQPIYQNKKVNLNIHNQVEGQYEIDGEKLSQILYNLLSNALKFTPTYGAVSVTIIKSIQQHKEGLEIKVSDNGKGIPAKYHDKLFDRFFQVDSSDTRSNEGTGIGLAIVKEFVEMAEGSITLSSEINNGATFSIFIPAKEIPQRHMSQSITTERNRNSVSDTRKEQEAHNELLIIEDNVEVQKFIESCLPSTFHVKKAYDGYSGKEIALKNIPDIIILDWMMPELDGITVCKKLKSDPITCHIPILMLTAKTSEVDRLSTRLAGADDYIAKPFLPDELITTLHNLLESRKKYAEWLKRSESTFENSNDILYNKIISLVERNLQNPDLDVSFITRELGISRTQLHRKLKAITGESINSLIRLYRLEKAKELLLTSELSISEVSYLTGFNTPSYFTKRFKEHFGYLPTELTP